jgi:ABC-type bacteriocin/lantibiotic exporter with double-glycine peptidase domain
VSTIQANGISFVNALIIDSIEKGSKEETYTYYYKLVILSALFIYIYYTYKSLQTTLLTKLRQWIKFRLVGLLLKTNNENMSEINYSKVSSPINRIASVCFMLFTDLFSGMLPSLSFTFIISMYLIYSNLYLGLLFLFGNILVFTWIAINWNTMFEKNDEYEKHTTENESYILEILNNIDKIIFRGQVENEVNEFRRKTIKSIEKAIDFYFNVEHSSIWLNIIVSFVVISCIWFAITQYYDKKIDKIFFVSFMTMILLYRDKMVSFVQMVPDFIEFIGRTNSVLKHFKDIQLEEEHAINEQYKMVDLPFHRIDFVDLEFNYKGNATPIFKDLNISINTTNNRIIGVTGISGKGKSTIMKMLLKLYKPSNGNIFIDGENIKDLDPDYIRQNITYVNQTGKLFDRKVIENIMYGCNHSEECTNHLKQIMSYPKIKELFDEIDIFNKQSGSLGENLSGGQRQVINIIGGIINPSKILILDEPTNALDVELKKEIIRIIKDYKQLKNAVIIITHDKDVIPIMDEKLSI